MNKLLLTTTYFLFFILTIQAQYGTFDVAGRIFHYDTPVSDVHIFNTNSKQGTITNINGAFTLEVKANDTLRISHLNYKTILAKITPDVVEGKVLILYLDSHTNYLETVELKNHDLSGLLFSDTKQVDADSINQSYHYKENILELAKLPSKADSDRINYLMNRHDVNPIKMGAGGGGIGIPFKDKENTLRRELRQKKSTPDKIISSLGKDYFTGKLKIPEDKIYRFLTYCNFRNIYDLYNDNKIIELINILEVESRSFLIKTKDE